MADQPVPTGASDGPGPAPTTTAARLDRHLVDRGLARSRTQAQALVREGRVTVGGRVQRRPSYAVQSGDRVDVTERGEDWVGRAAVKLVHALATWGGAGLEVRGRRCLDVGASTGGFTQVLLRHGASHVTALDVGHAQLAPELRADPRVRDLPGTNVRGATAEQLGGAFDLVVADLSFISLTSVLPVLASLVEDEGEAVVLVKPQFEVGRRRLGKGGVVRSPVARAEALRTVTEAATAAGLPVHGIERSPVTGTHGNIEYLLWLSPRAPGMMGTPDTAARIAGLTAEEED